MRPSSAGDVRQLRLLHPLHSQDLRLVPKRGRFKGSSALLRQRGKRDVREPTKKNKVADGDTSGNRQSIKETKAGSQYLQSQRRLLQNTRPAVSFGALPSLQKGNRSQRHSVPKLWRNLWLGKHRQNRGLHGCFSFLGRTFYLGMVFLDLGINPDPFLGDESDKLISHAKPEMTPKNKPSD